VNFPGLSGDFFVCAGMATMHRFAQVNEAILEKVHRFHEK
jgi:hypothetical protein